VFDDGLELFFVIIIQTIVADLSQATVIVFCALLTMFSGRSDKQPNREVSEPAVAEQVFARRTLPMTCIRIVRGLLSSWNSAPLGHVTVQRIPSEEYFKSEKALAIDSGVTARNPPGREQQRQLRPNRASPDSHRCNRLNGILLLRMSTGLRQFKSMFAFAR
jgi:hypothetical protein